MEKTKLRRLGVIAAMVALPFAGDAQLLKGKAEGAVRELQLAISLDGDQGATEYKTLELKDDGTFEFDAVLPSPFNDVIVYVNDGECVGVRFYALFLDGPVAGGEWCREAGLTGKGNVSRFSDLRGKIITANVPRPSDPDIIGFIEGHLN